MKVVLIFDQGLAGAGGKSNPNLALSAAKGGIGSALMLEPHFKKINAEIIATLYCGNEYFLNNKEEVVIKMTAMVKKLNPDIVVCGPCFNFNDYALMSAMIVQKINSTLSIPAVAMMSIENTSVIADYSKLIPIIKMPKKGGSGLNDSLSDLARWLECKVNQTEDIEILQSKICF